MAIRMPRIIQAKQPLKRSSSSKSNSDSSADVVPKGHLAVYVGEGEKKRYVIPIAYLNQPSLQELLSLQAEQEFGYDHPMGGLTIPCTEDMFIHLTSRLSRNSCYLIPEYRFISLS